MAACPLGGDEGGDVGDLAIRMQRRDARAARETDDPLVLVARHEDDPAVAPDRGHARRQLIGGCLVAELREQ
ncbi:MAG TPA: hypothetical protein VM033_04470 [Gemmatimonadaceae bacterium]|nr:hypothetical protein [Gemmatimonadaceae bacterium]